MQNRRAGDKTEKNTTMEIKVAFFVVHIILADLFLFGSIRLFSIIIYFLRNQFANIWMNSNARKHGGEASIENKNRNLCL